MSRLKRDMSRKKLLEYLSRADDESFLQLLWAVNALQSGRSEAASRYIEFPAAAATDDISSDYAVHDWELETLASQLLVTPKFRLRHGNNWVPNCGTFHGATTAVNHLRDLEDAEAGEYLKQFSVLNEMHRIGQRQFSWQRGYFNRIQIYRHIFIFGRGECANFFKERCGVSVADFVLVAFGLFSSFLQVARLSPRFSENFGLEPCAIRSALRLLCLPLSEIRMEALTLLQSETKKMNRRLPMAFRPSILRRFPIVSFGQQQERLRSPLPELILARATSGLYYDLIAGPTNVLTAANDNFEAYSERLLDVSFPRFHIQRSHTYKVKGDTVDSPDLLVSDGGRLRVVVECKAAKLTFGAQFSESPVTQAERAYSQIAKGVFQVWRYFSHIRLGFVRSLSFDRHPQGVVLTLDAWLVASPDLQKEVVEQATKLANTDGAILPEDRRPVVFCPIHDLEEALAFANEDVFLRMLSAACEERFLGWTFPSVRKHCDVTPALRRPYPFDLNELLPWWGRFGE